MIKNVITHIGGVEAYGIISICFFFAVFLGALAWAFTRKKNYVETMSALPLDDGERVATTSTDNPSDIHNS